MSGNWENLVEMMQKEIKDEFLNNDGKVGSDFLAECVDSSVPVYNSDRLELLEDNHDLAYTDMNSSDLMPEKVESIYDFLAVTIYCELQKEADNYLMELEDNCERCQECDCMIGLNYDDLECRSKNLTWLCVNCDVEDEEDKNEE